MDDPDRWPDDYFASRECFVKLAGACSARLASRPVEARGPEGEALSVSTRPCRVRAGLTATRNSILLINARAAPDMAGELGFWLRAGGLIARRRGIASLAKDIAEGQDRFPKGLFFSGTEAGESALGLQDLLLDLSSGASRVTHLDLHSGLRRSGSVTLIGNTDIGPVGRRAENLRAHFRQPVSLDDNADNPYDVRSTLGRWYRRAMGDTRWLYFCVEIGTANPLKVLSALKRENQAHHWSAPGARSYRETKRRLLNVFAPRSSGWRQKSVAESLWAFERSLALPIDRKHVATVALANKTARMAWAIAHDGVEYDPALAAAAPAV